MPRPRTSLVPAACICACWVAVVLLVGPGGDFPLDDDWAYAWSARHLAATGELRILDWAAPSLASHAAWGAVLVRLFGPSYAVLRAGTLGFGGAGLLVLLSLGRRAGLDDARAALLALGVGLSPWYLDLSFTYMTDVPWLVLVCGAQLVMLRRGGGGSLRLVAVGLLLGAAALTRQYALVVAPAFVALAVADGRAAGRSLARSMLRGALVALPVAALYGAYHIGYVRVHGETLAARNTWDHMAHLPLWFPVAHTLVAWHYVGLWSLPVALALVAGADRRWPALERRDLVCAGLLIGYAVAAALSTYLDRVPALGLNAQLPPTMPYLGNVAWLVGLGPPTLEYAAYVGREPLPHAARWLGWPLSLASTAGGVACARWLGPALAGAVQHLRTPSDEPRERARLLLVGSALLYLAFQAGTATLVFDRYLLPLLPVALWLALDAAGERALRAPVLVALALTALFSIAGTREHLSWNAARHAAVHKLEAAGVPATEIDGGFEVNAERHFATWLAAHGTLNSPAPNPWWVGDTRYRLAWDDRAGCRTVEEWPYFSLTGTRRIHVLDCR